MLAPVVPDGALSGVKTLCLYSVTEGKLLETRFTQEQLRSPGPITVEGHVCGLVILCEDETVIQIEGKQASKIQKNADSTCFVKFKGKMKPEQLGLPSFSQPDRASEGKELFERKPAGRGEDFIAGAYSIFPRITGDMVSVNSEFEITIESKGKTASIPVRQNGYQALRTFCRDTECKRGEIVFRHAGASLDPSQKESADLDAKFFAIAEGIVNVERTFGVELVSRVNILDYQDLKNAVTCDEGSDIWFYAEALRKESAQELKVMAEHESLHKLVSALSLTTSSDVRELFSDLRGYDDFSNERFMLMMSGYIPPEVVREKTEVCPFFSFIDERNFLEGVKGGHSHESLEEYCTSFLHSLMFLERLEQNLVRRVKLSSNPSYPRVLTLEEKADTLDAYVRSIEVLIDALPDRKAGGAPTVLSAARTESFLKEALTRARDVRIDWLPAREESPDSPPVR